MKQYKEPSQLSFCLFIFAYFFIFIKAMNEDILEKLKQKEREKKLERKTKAFRKKQIRKEKVEQVRLTRVIYVEPLALHAPTTKEIRIFEQE